MSTDTGHAPAVHPEESPTLDPLLDDLPFGVRLREWAAAKGATTLRQLARLPPQSLLADPGQPSTTLQDARLILERFLGRTWEEMAGLAPLRPLPSPVPLRHPTGWDELRLVLPARVRAWPLDGVHLPPRMETHVRRAGLRTLGELARCSEAQLLKAGGIGRLAVRDLFRNLTSALHLAGVRVHLPPPAGAEPESPDAARAELPRARTEAFGLLEGWQRHLRFIPDEPRRAMALHAGLDGGPRLTSAAVGEEMRTSGARAYRLDAQARALLVRDKGWIAAVKARFDAVLVKSPVRLARLAGDPFWAEIVVVPQALDYFAEAVLEEASVIEIDGQIYLARWPEEDD